MISVDDIPIGGAPTKCQLCGMVARPPIVIPERSKDGTFADVGVCRNTRVCNVRQSRAQKREREKMK